MTMQVDFYQLSQSPVEAALPLLARATLGAGQRLVVVAQQPDLLERIGKGLWELKDSFLAHGRAGSTDEARQPILLSDKAEGANGARFVALADGQWRDEALGFERAMLVFDEATVEAARGVWRKLDGDATLTRRYFKQEAGKWVQAA
jgi:DNA polymerase III subunit chi